MKKKISEDFEVLKQVQQKKVVILVLRLSEKLFFQI